MCEFVLTDGLLSFLCQPPSLNTSRILASKTARRILADPVVSEAECAVSCRDGHGVCVQVPLREQHLWGLLSHVAPKIWRQHGDPVTCWSRAAELMFLCDCVPAGAVEPVEPQLPQNAAADTVSEGTEASAVCPGPARPYWCPRRD